MTTEIDILLKAVDEASAVLSGAADKIRGSMGGVEKATNQVAEANKKTDSSTKDLVTGFSGVATGAFALYMTIDRVEKSQFALEKANLAVARANESVESTQKKYNEAVLKFGLGSEQAKDASDKLAIAQDAFALANDRASLAQGNVNQAMMQGALTIVPTLITIVSSAKNALGGMEGAQKLLNQAMDANPIFLVIGAIAALVAILVTAYYTIQPFRDAVDGLGRFLGLLPPALDDVIAATKQYQVATESANRSVLEAQMRVEATGFAADNFTNTLLDTAKQVQSYDDVLTRNCSTLEDYQDLSSDASSVVEDLQDRMKSLQADCEATNRVLEGQIDNLGEGSAAVSLMGRDTDRLTASEREYSGQIEELNRKIAENTDLTKEQIAAIEDQIEALIEAAQRAEDTADLMADLSESYAELQAAADASLPEVARQFDEAFKSGRIEEATNLVIAFADKWGLSFDDAEKVIESWEETVETSTETVVDSVETVISEFDKFKAKITGQFELAKAAADSNLSAIASAFDVAFDAGRFSDAAGVVQAFADEYGISFDQAEQVINNFTDEQKKALDKQTMDAQKAADAQIAAQKKVNDAFAGYADKIKSDFFDKVTSESVAFKEEVVSLAQRMADSWNSMAETSIIQSAIMTANIQGFATQWGISWDEAHTVITKAADGIDAEIGRVPKSIESQLISKAQDDFQKFQDCVTGKARTLNADVTGQMDNLASNITDLINKGLVGEAQNEMQAYVDCNTNKTATMVEDINGMIEKLTSDYNAQLAVMTAQADSLTGAQKNAVLRQIDELTAGYRARMQQLSDWQDSLLSSMVSNADRMLAAAQVERAALAAGTVQMRFQEVMETAAPVLNSRGMAAPGISSLAAQIGASEKPSVHIEISGPLVNIEGSADRATAEFAVSLAEERLKSVIVEQSSSSAPESSKRIRRGNAVVTI